MKTFSLKFALPMVVLQAALLLGQSAGAEVVSFAVTPATVSNTYTGPVAFHVGNLTSGETVVISQYLDVNNNGIIDSADVLFQHFKLTDGSNSVIGGVTNINVPGDTDGIANGQITATLNSQGNFTGAFIGNYLFKVSSPSNNFVPVTTNFAVTNVSYAQEFSGTVFTNGVAAPFVPVLLLRPSGGGGGLDPVGGAVANGAGTYTIPAPAGTYGLVAFQSNYVADTSASTGLVLGAGTNIATNLSLIAATAVISGQIVDTNNPTNGVPGLLMALASSNNLLTVCSTQTNGDFSAPVTASQWSLNIDSANLAIHGYVGLQGKAQESTASGSVTNVIIALPKASALFYGTVKDQNGNPLPGVVDLSASDNTTNGGGSYQAEGYATTNGSYVAAAVGGLGAADTWQLQIDNARNYSTYSFSQPDFDGNGGTNISAGQAVQVNLVALLATNQIFGYLLDNNGTPVAGVGISASATINGVNFQTANSDTGSNGYYSLAVSSGDWNVNVNCGCTDGDCLGTNYLCPNSLNVNITNSDVEADFTALLATNQITGVVTNTSGVGIANLGVFASTLDNDYSPFVYTDSNGNYTIAVGNGSWSVGLSCMGSNSLNLLGYECVTNEEVTISNANAVLDFGVQSFPAFISGRVVDDGGNPVTILNVFAFPTNGGNFYQATTDTNGNFSMGIVGGGYTLQLNNDTNSGFPARGLVGPSVPVIVTNGDNITNFVLVAPRVTGEIQVQVSASNVGVSNIGVFASMNVGDTNYTTYGGEIQTGSSGAATLPVFSGAWLVSLDGNEVQTAGYAPVSSQSVTNLNNTNSVIFNLSTVTALVVNTAGVTNGTVGVPYNGQIQVSGGVPFNNGNPYGISLVGAYPPGLGSTNTGLTNGGEYLIFSGTPSQNGAYPFNLVVFDSVGNQVTNNFSITIDLPSYSFTVSASPGNGGTVSPGGTNVSGNTVTVVATNHTGFVFNNWTSNGVVVTTSTNYSFAIATNVTLVANFLPLYTTTVSASPSNGGTVSPGGTNVSGSTVAVTATNNAGFAFENWTSNGVAVTTSSNYSFTIATNVTLVANFLPLYTTTVSASPTNGGAVSPGGTNVSGSTVSVTATNSPGYGFVNWTSNGVVVTTSTNYSFAIATNVTLVASFLPYYTTTVSASPSNGGTVSAGGTNLSGSTVAVVATNGAGFVFENWTSNGVAVATTTNYSFAIATNVTLVANFLPLYSITVSASPANGGTVGGGGTNVSGTTNTVTAAAAAGYAFSDWSSNSVTVSASNDYAFVLGTNVALVANFVLTPAQMEVLDGTNLITNNTAAPVEFGGVQSNQPGPIVTFTVTNLGGQALELTNVAVPAGFVLLTNGAGTITNFPWNIAGLSNGTFSVQLITTNIGTNAGEITITNSDTNQNPYVFAVSGTVSAPAPEIQVWNGSSLIVNNQTNAVSFGSVPLNQAGPILTFTVSNIGEETLAVSNLTVPAGYTLVSNAPGSIAAGSNGTFSVQLDTSLAGVMAGNITLADNDTNNNPFIFPVTGLVTTRIMALGGSLGFGVVPVDETAHGTLTISNSGDVNLTVSNITYPAGFSGAFSGVIAPGSAQSVTVTFAPLLPTNYAGVVTVNSDATGGAGSLAVTGFGANTNLVLTIITNGAGTVTPALAGKALKAGVKYTLTATAKSGNVFSNWTGSLSTNKNPLTFTMETSTIFEANFVPNPFLGLEGTYNGLFTPANGVVTEETSGMLKGLTVAGKGTYSGTLLLNGGSHALSGSFNLSGQATNVISRPASQGGPVVLEMTLNSNGPAPQISGTVSGVTNAAAWVAALTADYATNTLASAQYTLLLPPDTNNAPPAHSPGGESYATITNYAGTAKNPASANAKITGALADGTAFSQTVPVSYDGYVPVYANLYTGKGLLLGWINLDLTNTAGASLTWIHPATKTGLYTGGFTNQLLTNQIQLSRWSNAPAAIAQLTNLTLLETSAATNAETNIAISIDAAGKITGASVSGTLNPKTGVLTVTIGSGADKVSGYGAVLLDATNGGGYFLTKTNAQAIHFGP